MFDNKMLSCCCYCYSVEVIFYDSDWNPCKGAFRRQVDWQQVGALARAGPPVLFWVRDKSPHVTKWQDQVAKNVHFGKLGFNRRL